MSSPELAVTYENGSARPTSRPARPRVAIPVINLSTPPYSYTPTLQIPMTARPMTPGAGYPPSMIFPNTAYQNKASEFMFKRFEGFKDFTMNTAKSGLSVGEKFAFWSYGKLRAWSKNWFTHIFLFFVVFLYTVLGALLFVAIEGPVEERQLEDMRVSRYKLLEELVKLLNDSVVRSDSKLWSGKAVNQMLLEYEPKVIDHYKLYGRPPNDNPEAKKWDFFNALFFCGTVYTTIGYGHISPSTTTGRAITIIYAIFGIPMFLILLTDFGKLFTRGIKFLWAFVRRLYYTGSCRKVRRTGPVQDVMKGVALVYNFATNRRPSQIVGDVPTVDILEQGEPLHPPPPLTSFSPPPPPLTSFSPQPPPPLTSLSPPPPPITIQHDNLGPAPDGVVTSLPGTPVPSNFEVDDEFNLPISVAIVVLLIYIFVGATMYYIWETWGFFESFYFVFISMSTIGFGDFVPQHPMYMMASIVYLIFGLALTSMCINVVQEKLSASFQQASAKIGATIGLRMAEQEASITPAPPPPEVELPEVHLPKTKKAKGT